MRIVCHEVCKSYAIFTQHLPIIYEILYFRLQIVTILKNVIEEVEGLLKLQDISKQYDEKVVLKDINLEIGTGEIVSLLGQSGSGKTTLLNIILGLTKMNSGKIIFNDVDVSHVPMKDRGFNIVFQDYALFPHLNAYENIIYGLRNKKGSVSEKEVQEYIEFLELKPHLTKKIGELSGGQKQRVALARTLVTKPKILLLDEPLSALDGVIKESIKERIKSIAKEFNLTTIIVTHDPEEALTLSDKILIINNGSISQFGTPNEIIQRPSNAFVKEFILRQLQIKRQNILNLFGEQYA
jgi:iron(III) transport system ATP-binding protein